MMTYFTYTVIDFKRGTAMKNRAKTSEAKIHLLKRKSSFELFFCTLMLTASAYFLYKLCASNAKEQYTIFFGGPASGDSFMDFFNVVKYVSTRDPYHYTELFGLSEKAYPPLAYLMLYPFSLLLDYKGISPVTAKGSQLGIMSLFFFLGVSVLIYAFLLYHYKTGSGLTKAATVFALFSSGTFLFAVERANTIILTVGFLAAFLFWYKSDSRRLREFSYIALACAAALKVYPAIFGILLLRDRRIWDAVRTATYGILAFFLPFFFFTGGRYNFSQLLINVGLNTEAYRFLAPNYRFGWIAYYLWVDKAHPDYQSWINFGNIMMVLAVVLCFALKDRWKMITLLTCAVIATPVNSAYYCGLYIFIPIVFFLNENKHSFVDWIYLILFAAILNPIQFLAEKLPVTVPAANIALLILFFILLVEAAVRAGIAAYSFISSRFSKSRLQKAAV